MDKKIKVLVAQNEVGDIEEQKIYSKMIIKLFPRKLILMGF